MGTVLHHETSFSKPRQHMVEGCLLDIPADRPGIASWDAAADAIGDRYASVRAIRDEPQREFMREAFAATRPGKGDLS